MVALRARYSIGERLRRARAEREIDLDRAAVDTGIDRAHLEALEADAPLDEHHAGLYARIFLREYARYLGLDPKPLVGAYRATHPEPARPLIGGPPPVERRPTRWAAPVLALLSAGALVALAVVGGLRPSAQVPVPPESTLPEPASPSPTQVGGVTDAAPPPADRMVLRVLADDCWVRVSRDGEVLTEETLPAGSTRGFRVGDGLELILGNAGAVRLTVGGDRLGGLGDGVYTGRLVLRDEGPKLLPLG